jgi:DNA (cytosine-5)-methyltransferase 1
MATKFKMGTFCSGIAAPEMAAKDLFEPIFFSEIEPFPCAVLSHHWPGVPNLGDMTASDLVGRIAAIGLPDIIVAGLPCQPFSVAGLRKGEKDSRNLTTTFIEVSHAINDLRRAAGKPALCALVENVPGLLSDRGNAFGCFLGGLVGAMDALPPPADGSWPGEGMVQGPRARAAWAVLDAQWFGLAQRRKRVFVVVDFGNCVDPAAVLLEPDRLRGDTPPRRETGERPAPTISARTKGGGGLGTDFDCDGGLIAAEVAPTLNAHFGGKMGLENQHINGGCGLFVSHTLKGEGFDASEDGTGRGTPIVPVVAGTVKACRDSGGWSNSADHAAAGYMIPVAFDCKGTEVQYSTDGSHPTLRSMGHSNSHQNAGGHAAVAEPFVMMERGRADGRSLEYRQDGTANAILTPNGERGGFGIGAIAAPLAVRRLMPVECARLQGFPDDHAAITYRGKPAADGNQYKAFGNSMAVPCVAWILSRMKISMEAAE